MPSTTHIVVTDNLGARLFETDEFLEIGDTPGLHYVLSCGQVGALTVTLPTSFNTRLVAGSKPIKDARIHVMRSVNGRPAAREGEACFLARAWTFANDYTAITALHANHLMWRRHVLYLYLDAASEQGPLDDMIKDTFTHNNFSDAFFSISRQGGTTSYDLTGLITVQANLGAAPSSFKRMGWMNVGDMILEMANESTGSGTYLTAEIVCPTEGTLELRTYTGQRGTDRRFAGGNTLLFAEGRGNLADAKLTIDATQEITHATAGGPSRDWTTTIRYSQSTTRMAESPFGRIETFVDSTTEDTNELLSDAIAAQRAGRAVIRATAELQETDQCVRGVQFDYGDYVTVEVNGVQYDMRLDVIDVALQAGAETTKASFYADE